MTDTTINTSNIAARIPPSDAGAVKTMTRSGRSVSKTVTRKLGLSLRGRQDFIVREWLKRLIDDLGLDSLRSFPTRELTRDIPGLIGLMSDHLLADGAAELDASGIMSMVSTIGDVRKENSDLPRLVQDYVLLKRLMIEAAVSGLRNSDRAVIDGMTAIDEAFHQILQAGLENYFEKNGSETGTHADTDALTNLYNVRYFRRQLHRQLEMYKRYRNPFSLLMLDLDGLQQLNDTLGDEAGDAALKNLASILLEEKRETDIAVRYGGDEFFLLLPGTINAQGERLAYRLSRRVKELNLRSNGAQITGVSIGVVSCPENGTDVGTLRSRADKAMYMAKLLGGNRVARYRDFQQT